MRIDDTCPMCGADVEDGDRLHRCPTCACEGYGECCFPTGNNTECLDCQENPPDEDDCDE